MIEQLPVSNGELLFSQGLIVPSPSIASSISIMAFGTCGRKQVLGVAIPARGPTVMDAAATLIGNAWVRTGVLGRPIIDSMALHTIQPEHPDMEGRIAVTVTAYS